MSIDRRNARNAEATVYVSMQNRRVYKEYGGSSICSIAGRRTNLSGGSSLCGMAGGRVINRGAEAAVL
jgi:hypothetical protein